MSEHQSDRTQVVDTATMQSLSISGARRDVHIVCSETHSPHLLVTDDTNRARWFNLDAVTTENHGWIDADGLGGRDESVRVVEGADIDTVLVRDVAEGMVAIDYATDAPRLLLWTEHEDADQEPRRIQL